jgi:hypothetical protein
MLSENGRPSGHGMVFVAFRHWRPARQGGIVCDGTQQCGGQFSSPYIMFTIGSVASVPRNRSLQVSEMPRERRHYPQAMVYSFVNLLCVYKPITPTLPLPRQF